MATGASDSVTDNRQKDDLGFDDLVEDTFGLNLKGVQSILVLFRKPQAYFEAALDPDWLKTYTPSIRLWFSVTAVIFFFNFLWADTDASTIQAMITSLDESGMELPAGVTSETAALTLARWWFGFLPFTTMAFYLVLGYLWPWWGRPLTATLRIRNVFATVVPGTVLTLFTTLGMAWLPASWFLPYYVLVILMVFAVDSATAWRGLFTGLSGWARHGRALLLGGATALAALTASFVAQTLGLVTIYLFYFP